MPAPKGHKPYNVNGEGGRPKIWTEEKLNKEAEFLEKWVKVKGNLFIEDFCIERGYHDSDISKWAKENDRFNGAYKNLLTKQKVALVKGSLTRKFAHPMCALLLSHSHGMHAKTEQKITGDASAPLSFLLGNVDGQSKDLVVNG